MSTATFREIPVSQEPEGPYFDFSARADYLTAERDTAARLCAKKLFEGDDEGARYWAADYAKYAEALRKLMAWYDASDKEDRGRWVGHRAYREAEYRAQQTKAWHEG